MASLLRLERQQKNYLNVVRIRIFLLLSSSFEIETINTFIHSRSLLENRVGTYLYSLYKGVPRVRARACTQISHTLNIFRLFV